MPDDPRLPPDSRKSPLRRCPICRRKADRAFAPFCSSPCREVDLARWLGGEYRIAGAAAQTPAEGEADDPADGTAETN